jgi:hypothetical protein
MAVRENVSEHVSLLLRCICECTQKRVARYPRTPTAVFNKPYTQAGSDRRSTVATMLSLCSFCDRLLRDGRHVLRERAVAAAPRPRSYTLRGSSACPGLAVVSATFLCSLAARRAWRLKVASRRSARVSCVIVVQPTLPWLMWCLGSAASEALPRQRRLGSIALETPPQLLRPW